jgi:NitT/TauT family transport system substrate-binding protein
MKKIILCIFCFSSIAMTAERQVKLALNWKPEAEFGGIYAAQVGEIFKKHNLDVEILQGGAGTPSVQMVAGGKLDFGIASGDEIVIAQSHGAKVVALFATYQTNAQGIMVHEDSGFKTLADVFASPNKLAMQKGLPYAMYLMKKFRDSKAQVVPYLGGISPFLSDKTYSQQVFITSEPLSAAKKNMKVKTFLVSEAGYNPYTTVLITREEVLKLHPDIAKDLVTSIREGLKAYLSNPSQTNLYMNTLNPSIDIETLKKSAEIQQSLIENSDTAKSGIGTMTTERWNELIDQLFALKLIQKKVPADQVFHNL